MIWHLRHIDGSTVPHAAGDSYDLRLLYCQGYVQIKRNDNERWEDIEELLREEARDNVDRISRRVG